MWLRCRARTDRVNIDSANKQSNTLIQVLQFSIWQSQHRDFLEPDMPQPPDMGALRLNDDLDQEYDDMPYEDEDVDYDMDIDLGPTPSKPSAPRPETSESREAALRKELESVRQINKVIEDVVTSLEKAKGNMDVCFTSCCASRSVIDTR